MKIHKWHNTVRKEENDLLDLAYNIFETWKLERNAETFWSWVRGRGPETAPSSLFLAINLVPSLSPLQVCGVHHLGPAAVLCQAGSSSALITSMVLFSASEMMQFYLFIFLPGMLRRTVSGVCNSCSAVSQQCHLCQLLLLYLSVHINQCLSWAFLICVYCVCVHVFKFWSVAFSSYAIHVSGSLNCIIKGKQNCLCFHVPFSAKFSRNLLGQQE